jgi:hypothetical protein
VIAAFFKNLDYINDSIWRHLVRILVNRLYLDSGRSSKKWAVPSHEFVAQILLLGQKPGCGEGRDAVVPSANKEGIRFIVELYKRSRSFEARDNLFYVIFDYIHYCYRRMIRSNNTNSTGLNPTAGTTRPSKLSNTSGNNGVGGGNANPNDPSRKYAGAPPTSAQFALILDLLTRIDAPQYFASIFKYPPPNFVNHVIGLINHVAANSIDSEFNSIWTQTDPIVIRRVLKDFASLAELTLKMSPSFAEDCAILLSEPTDTALLNASLKSITSLINGKASQDASNLQAVQFERQQGSQWMQQLMQIVWNVKLSLGNIPLVESRKQSSSVPSGIPVGKPRSRKESASSSLGPISAATITTTSLHGRQGRTSKETPRGEVESPVEGRSPRNSVSEPKQEVASKDHTHHKDHGKDGGKDHKDHKDHKDTSDKTLSSSGKSPHHATVGPSGSKVQPVNLSIVTTLAPISTGTTPRSPSAPSSPKDVVPLHLMPTRGLHLRTADASFVETVETTFFSYVKSSDPTVRRSYLRIVEAGIYYIDSLSDQGASSNKSTSGSVSSRSPRAASSSSMLLDPEALSRKCFELLNTSFLKLIKVGGETSEANLQLMFDMIIEFTMLIPNMARVALVPSLIRSSSSSASLGDDFTSRPRTSSGSSINTNAAGGGGGGSGGANISSKDKVIPLQSQTIKSPGRDNHSHHTHHTQSAFEYNLSDSDESFGSDDFTGPQQHGRQGSDGMTDQSPLAPPSPQLDRLAPSPSPPESSSRAVDMVDLNNQDDSPAGLFMRGKLEIVRSLLEQVNIEILLHLFTHLPPRMNSATRPVVLHFLTERCKHSTTDLDTVGGSSFFKKLLTENDPLIS